MQIAESQNSVAMYFAKYGLITAYKCNDGKGVEIVLKTGEMVTGINGSNQFRQYFVSAGGQKGYLCMRKFKVVWC